MPTKEEIVIKGVEQFASIETKLAKAREGMISLQETFRLAYSELIVPTGTDCMGAVSTCGILAGKIAEIEAALYPFHLKATEWAKAAGCDQGGGYAVLAKYEPPHTEDGGR